MIIINIKHNFIMTILQLDLNHYMNLMEKIINVGGTLVIIISMIVKVARWVHVGM